MYIYYYQIAKINDLDKKHIHNVSQNIMVL